MSGIAHRSDNVGMWWQDYVPPPSTTRANRVARNIIPPRTGWEPPREFPNLATADILGLDVETKDLQLLERGPGAVRGAANLVGISIATRDRAWYFPIRHEYAGEPAYPLPRERVLAWLNEVLERPVPIVGANLLYDLEALRAEGVRMPSGPLFDVQYAQPLLDENARSYSLDTLAAKHLGRGKETSLLYQWCAESFGGEPTGAQRKNIWRSPSSLVGPYAEADAQLPLRILDAQRPLLEEQALTDLFRLECDLIPVLLDMRFRGVRVDVQKAEATIRWLREQAAEHQAKLRGVDVWSAESVARAFDAAGVEYVRTEAGNPSFTKQWLEACEHPIAKQVLGVRAYEKAANPFVESYILGAVHNGRVHCQFHPLRSDDYGTVSGRLSSSNPNLQNIPARDPTLGPMLRSLFIPEEGCLWRRADYSQIEYRLLAHDAVGRTLEEKRNAEAMRARYQADATTDFHSATEEMVREHTGVELGRKAAKNLNFGLVYGMGKDKTTRSLGVSPDLGTRLYDAYFAAMPAVKHTYRSAQRLAERRGYIKTILGRRRRFELVEGGTKYGEQRDGTHKALNARLQGSAADVMKKAMVDCHKAGVFAATGVPHLTVHDELDWSDPRTKESAEAFAEAERIMTQCIPLRVPLMVDVSVGANWGECK